MYKWAQYIFPQSNFLILTMKDFLATDIFFSCQVNICSIQIRAEKENAHKTHYLLNNQTQINPKQTKCQNKLINVMTFDYFAVDLG